MTRKLRKIIDSNFELWLNLEKFTYFNKMFCSLLFNF